MEKEKFAKSRADVEAQLSAFEVGAQELRQPLFLWNVTVWRAMLRMLDKADASYKA